MPLKMMHTQGRLTQRRRQRAGHASADQQRTRQARPSGVGNHIDIGQGALRALHDFLRQRQHAPDMVAAGQLRHHAAIGLVHGDLAVQSVREQTGNRAAVGIDQRHACFITT